MSAHQQVDLHNPLLVGGGGWATERATRKRGDTQVRKPARKRGLARMFARTAEERTIVDRELFLHTLEIERKRAERSGKEFMLVLLHSSEMPAELEGAIFSTIRDTDVVGWYEKNEAALGVLFTEQEGPNQSVAAAILRRMSDAISNCVAPELATSIGISCHIFRDRATTVDSFETVLVAPHELLVPAQHSTHLAAAND